MNTRKGIPVIKNPRNIRKAILSCSAALGLLLIFTPITWSESQYGGTP